MDGGDGLVCVPCPVVKNAVGKKRRQHDGQACEAPDCDEFFSSSWYPQGRCCAKAKCKRFFGVAGVYHPKKVPKGILKKAAPLADCTNAQHQVQPKPTVAAPPPPKQAAASAGTATRALPGRNGGRRPLAALEAMQQQFGGTTLLSTAARAVSSTSRRPRRPCSCRSGAPVETVKL